MPPLLNATDQLAQGLRNTLKSANVFGDKAAAAAKEIGGRAKDAVVGIQTDDNTLYQSEYDFKSTTFPLDLATEYNGHYMVININVPVYRSGERRGVFRNQNFGTMLPNELSKVDVLRFGSNVGTPAAGAQQREIFSLPRNTRRIKESIALFMPNSLLYSQQNAYEDISLTAIAGSIGVGALSRLSTIAGAAIGGAIGNVGGAIGGAFIGGMVGQIVSGAGSVIGQGSRLMGYPINPRVEIVFATTPQRQFVFEVLMAPRNAAESEAIRRIVQTLRFHAAPELDPVTKGLTFIPPAEFDITFFNKGEENGQIPRINTCVLNRIDVDYSPTGVYSTFHNGAPVAVRMSLAFTEIEILHKLRVAQGF